MVENKIRELLFESSQWIPLEKKDLTDDQLIKLYSTKPGEINIILARVAELIKGDHPGKTKRDVMIEILEVLGRSFVARQVFGTGLQDNYRLFKGFPVRNGDEHDDMPEPNIEIQLKPKDSFLSWTTSATQGREDGATYDSTKGEPIGGLLVDTAIDSGKILFDVNAVTRFVKSKINSLNLYNQRAAPGMAISQANIDYFIKEAQAYTDKYEVMTPTAISNVKVADRWTRDESGTVKWQMSDKPESETEKEPAEPIDKEDDPVKEAFTLLESSHAINEYLFKEESMELEEGIMNMFSKLANTVRGRTLKYLDALVEQYKIQIEMFKAVREYASMIPGGAKRVKLADQNIKRVSQLYAKAKSLSDRVVQNSKLGLDFSSVDSDGGEEA